MKFYYNSVLLFLNNHKDLDPSFKMDLNFWDGFGRKHTLSYDRRNKVCAKNVNKAYMYMYKKNTVSQF